jgi:hypothetical protein
MPKFPLERIMPSVSCNISSKWINPWNEETFKYVHKNNIAFSLPRWKIVKLWDNGWYMLKTSIFSILARVWVWYRSPSLDKYPRACIAVKKKKGLLLEPQRHELHLQIQEDHWFNKPGCNKRALNQENTYMAYIFCMPCIRQWEEINFVLNSQKGKKSGIELKRNKWGRPRYLVKENG